MHLCDHSVLTCQVFFFQDFSWSPSWGQSAAGCSSPPSVRSPPRRRAGVRVSSSRTVSGPSAHELRVALGTCYYDIHPDPHGLRRRRHHVVEAVVGLHAEGQRRIWALGKWNHSERRWVFNTRLWKSHLLLLCPQRRNDKNPTFVHAHQSDKTESLQLFLQNNLQLVKKKSSHWLICEKKMYFNHTLAFKFVFLTTIS